MKKGFLFLFIFGMILLFGFVSAENFVFEQSTDVDLKISCFNEDNQFCNNTVKCNVTILEPDHEVLIDNQPMTWNSAYFNYPLNSTQTSILGRYSVIGICVGNTTGFSTFTFLITPNGELPTTAKGILYLGLLFVFIIFFVLCLYGGKEAKGVVGRSAFFLGAYLFLIGISFIAWNLSLDYLTSAPFMASFFRILWLFLMYALFPLIIILTFYTLWMMKKIDAIQSMINKGIPEDEAYGRNVKDGFKNRGNW